MSHAAAPIELRGVWQNNLKGFDLDLPTGQFIVVTGPSGSGKSSLAFDTLYAEGQRRYVETFSPYTRQFLDRMDKPRVDSIRGIPPAIAIEQSNHVKSTRSTVGTITEINDYLKVLFPRVAAAYCPDCGGPITPEHAGDIVAGALRGRAGATVLVTFGVQVPAGEKPEAFFQFLQSQGYLRVWLHGKVRRTDEPAGDEVAWLPGRVAVVQDRIALTEENRARATEAVETALRYGKGRMAFIDPASGAEEPHSTGWSCPRCEIEIRPPSPGLFSFNHPLGACPACRGFGRTLGIDLGRALPNPGLSISQGVVKPFQTGFSQECQADLLRCARQEGIDVQTPFEELSKSDQAWVLYGSSRRRDAKGPTGDELWQNGQWYGVKGYFDWLESKSYKMHVRVLLSRYRSSTPCPACEGGRLQPQALNFRLVVPWPPEQWPPLSPAAEFSKGASVSVASSWGQEQPLPQWPPLSPAAESGAVANSRAASSWGQEQPRGFRLPDLALLPLRDLRTVFDFVTAPANDPTALMVLSEIRTRLKYLNEVGLGYLTLDRPTRTLSGGEIERVNLTTCLGASLVNTLFVLDEPSVGLHPRDIGRLVGVIQGLRDKGNTLVVVEHEESVMRAADHLIDLGPGRGEAGGEVVFQGPLADLQLTGPRTAQSLTAAYLTGRQRIDPPPARRKPQRWLKLRGAREHNLRNLDVDFPLGVLCCVTGVSGSGKSTLVHDVLYQNLLRVMGLDMGDAPIGRCRELTGHEAFGQVVMVDQSPLARTPRSTPALYLGIYDAIRELYGTTEAAVSSGLLPGDFSFNSGNGRCERCGGTGFEKVEMQFLSDLYLRCSECEGRRFQPHVLEVRVAGKNIHDFLDLTVEQGAGFLRELLERQRWTTEEVPLARADEKRLREALPALQTLAEVGLGYLRLGQPLNTLSGGEAQRLKLVGHLVEKERRPDAKRALLIFDEPTTGLHFDDIAQLLRVFHRLVGQGESLLVVEHNLEVIRHADWLIDLGPEAGDQGGTLVAAGTPEEVAGVEESHTGRALAEGSRTKIQDSKKGKGKRGKEGARVVDDGLALVAEQGAEYRAQPWSAGSLLPPSLRPPAATAEISIHGAREHNLKNLTLTLPREKMVVITGLSGSGKSTLAFDLLFAEGQRRFLDSMSPYARQFVEQLEKPDVDRIEGLPPSVAIEQRITKAGGKSTVATVTEVYHFLRLLFAKLGTQYCPDCDVPVQAQSVAAITKQIEEIAKKGKVRLLAPLVRARKGFHTEVAAWAVRQGFDTLWVDGGFVPARNFEKLERFKEHTIDVVVAEIGPKEASNAVREAAKLALKVGKGTARLLDAKGVSTVLSTHHGCPECGTAFDVLDPRLFSFASPHGWCRKCRGFGSIWAGGALVKDDQELSEAERELAEERASANVEDDEEKTCPACTGARLNPVARAVRLQGSEKIEHFVRRPVDDALRQLRTFKFPKAQQEIARDIVAEIAQRLDFMHEVGLGYLTLDRAARTLSGGETQRIRLAAQLGSNLRGVLYVLDEPTIGLHPRDNEALLGTLEALREKGNSLLIVEHDEETMRRADFIIDLGPGAGVHGGEVVASGSLAEILPHPTSATAKALRAPLRHPLRGSRRPLPDRWLSLKGASANNLQNVQAMFAVGRLNVITGISGSGKSSLLHSCLLPAASAALSKGKKKKEEGKKKKEEGKVSGVTGALSGLEFLEAVYEVDQSPIGKTSRSTPGTYVGVLDDIRALFAQLPLARMRGYEAARFSFNVEGGRCETCGGHGVIKHEMAFLPTSYTPCEDCKGSRFNAATNEVLYNGKSIGEIMQLNIESAAEFFSASPRIARPLRLLAETGLGYLTLGQSSPTLSGGEAQRLKLVTELTRGVSLTQETRLRRRAEPKSILYLLEEPTVGLHMADVERLLEVLHRLVDDGGTVVVIEHHLDVIAEADWIVDLGPEAGPAGGTIVASGTPEQVARHKTSRIAPFLKTMLGER